MRLFRRSFLAVVLSVFAWSFAPAQAGAASAPATMVAGVIKASNVRGDVRRVNLADKSESPLRNGDTLSQENAVVTGTGESSAVLVFANGSTVRVGHQSRLEIKVFLMDPLDADIANVAALTREPTTSRTDLRLEFGEMVGNVKTLNHAAGASFSVSTPAGAAGIRGTTFRIVYRPTGNGQAFNFQLSTSEGVVVYEGTTTMGRTEVPVAVGREIVLTAQLNPTTNSVVVSFPAVGRGPGEAPGSVPMSREAIAALQEATEQIVRVQQQTPFSSRETQRPSGTPGSGGPPGQPGQPPEGGSPGQPGQPVPPGQAGQASQPAQPGPPAQGGPPGAASPAGPTPPTAPGPQTPPRPAALPPRTTPGDGR
jgi:hypothetical protein